MRWKGSCDMQEVWLLTLWHANGWLLGRRAGMGGNHLMINFRVATGDFAPSQFSEQCINEMSVSNYLSKMERAMHSSIIHDNVHELSKGMEVGLDGYWQAALGRDCLYCFRKMTTECSLCLV